MAVTEIKISELTEVTSITGTEDVPVVQGGATVRIKSNLLRTAQGFAVYDNAAVGNQSLASGVYMPMTNDGLASTTFTDELPEYSTNLFSSNRVDLENAPVNSIVTLRIVATLVSLSVNTEFDTKIVFRNSGGTIIFESILGHSSFKTTGSRTFTDVTAFYVGTAILNGTVELQIVADSNAEAYFNGVFISIP